MLRECVINFNTRQFSLPFLYQKGFDIVSWLMIIRCGKITFFIDLALKELVSKGKVMKIDFMQILLDGIYNLYSHTIFLLLRLIEP